jgi:hypothetical protein
MATSIEEWLRPEREYFTSPLTFVNFPRGIERERCACEASWQTRVGGKMGAACKLRAKNKGGIHFNS